VELINARNAKIEVEKELTQNKSQITELRSANTAWVTYTKGYFRKIVGAGLLAGIVLGGVVGYISFKLAAKFNFMIPMRRPFKPMV